MPGGTHFTGSTLRWHNRDVRAVDGKAGVAPGAAVSFPWIRQCDDQPSSMAGRSKTW